MSIFGTAAHSSNATQTAGTSLATSSTLNTALGDLLVIAVRWAGGNSATCTVSDTAGNTINSLPDTGPTAGNLQLFYCLSATIANAANTFTASWSIANGGFSFIYVWDIPISGGTASLDTHTELAKASADTTITTNNFSTTGTDEYITVAISPNATGETVAVSQSGYTLETGSIAASTYGGAAHGIFNTPQTNTNFTATWNAGAFSAVVLAAFFGTTSGGGNTLNWISTHRDLVNKRGLR